MKGILERSVLVCLATFAQDREPAVVGGGDIRARGPAPAQATGAKEAAAPACTGRAEHYIAVDAKGHPNVGSAT